MPAPDGHPGDTPALTRLRRLAWLMDRSIRLPGGFRIGLDGLIGLIPGVGDLLAGGVASYILLQAARMQVPVSVLLRMGLNVAIDLALGAIPVFGDIFDFVFKANERNIRLLDTYTIEPQRTVVRSRWVMVAVCVVVGLILAVAAFIVVKLVALLWVTIDA